jgi:hypothetical protein
MKAKSNSHYINEGGSNDDDIDSFGGEDSLVNKTTATATATSKCMSSKDSGSGSKYNNTNINPETAFQFKKHNQPCLGFRKHFQQTNYGNDGKSGHDTNCHTITTANESQTFTTTKIKRATSNSNKMASMKTDLKYYLERGKEVDENGLYPIHWACIQHCQDAKLIGMIIRSCHGCCKLQVRKFDSMKRNNSSIAKSLLVHKNKQELGNSGLDDDNNKNSNSTFNSNPNGFILRKNTLKFIRGMYPMHLAIVNTASIDAIKLLARSNPSVLSLQDENGMVPLSLACRYHDASQKREDLHQLILFLLAANPNAANIADVRCNTSLHYMCMTCIHSGGLQCQGGRSRSFTNDENDIGKTNVGPRIQVLESKNDNNLLNTQITQSGKKRSWRFNVHITSEMINANPEAVNKCNFNGNSPIDLALCSGNLDDQSMSLLQQMTDEEVEEAPDA